MEIHLETGRAINGAGEMDGNDWTYGYQGHCEYAYR